MIEFLQSRTKSQWLTASTWLTVILLLFGIGFLKFPELLLYIVLFSLAVYIGYHFP